MNRLLKRQNVPLLCDPTGLSAAWIDPTGVVHDLQAMGREREESGEAFLPRDHEEWAALFTGSKAVPEDFGDETDHVEELVNRGWIKVSNATSIDASNATSGAKASFARMLSKCVADGHIDPFEEIYIWTGDGSMILSSADLVEQWGSREMSEAMFAKLNARLEGRLSEARALRTLRGLVRALLT